MGEWLKHCDCDQHSRGSKPIRAILLCPWERHFSTLTPAWWSWQAVLNFSHISIKLKKQNTFNWTAISWCLQKQVRVIACPIYWHLCHFPASQKDKYRVKIIKKKIDASKLVNVILYLVAKLHKIILYIYVIQIIFIFCDNCNFLI